MSPCHHYSMSSFLSNVLELYFGEDYTVRISSERAFILIEIFSNCFQFPHTRMTAFKILSCLRFLIMRLKVAGSNPDEVSVFFNCPKPSSRTMALCSTQPLTEMSTRNPSGCKGWPARKAGNLTTSCEPIV
jgi:hypothetical protein